MPKYTLISNLPPEILISLCRKYVTATILSTGLGPEGVVIELDRELLDSEIYKLSLLLNATILSEDGRVLSTPQDALIWLLRNTKVDLNTGYLILPI